MGHKFILELLGIDSGPTRLPPQLDRGSSGGRPHSGKDVAYAEANRTGEQRAATSHCRRRFGRDARGYAE